MTPVHTDAVPADRHALVSGLLCLAALILAVCATLSAATSIDWNYAALVAGGLAAFFGACVWDRLR